MPWKKVSVVSSRQEFVSLALAEGANVSELCRRFNISQKTGYKWIGRFKREGERGLQDRSRRPHHTHIALPKRWRRKSWPFGIVIGVGPDSRSGIAY